MTKKEISLKTNFAFKFGTYFNIVFWWLNISRVHLKK